MAIRIIEIRPLGPTTIPTDPEAQIAAHVAIQELKWINDQTQVRGITPREGIYNWIVNQKGSAYIRKETGVNVFLFGASTSNNDHYVRTLDNGTWTNDLLSLPVISGN